MLNIFSKFLDLNQQQISRLQKIVSEINALESKAKKLKDTDFPKETEKLKKKLSLPWAFALAREASWRVLGQRPYDVQLIAGIALYEGKVAEQKTGEGKTLSAVAPLYLRALEGKGAHLVTVNDYLARLGAGWNGPVFDFLGLSVGIIVQEQKSFIYDPKFLDKSHGDERLSHLRPVDRKLAYEADITYGTNNEFGFDYLRDNMASNLSEVAQREHYFAIVDEVDSVLIDEARTPLIISAPDTEPTTKYLQFAKIIDELDSDKDYKVDEKTKNANLTEDGILKVEKLLKVENLYEKDFEAIHHIENALKARSLYLIDKDYVIREGQIVIVDEFTGRLMVGRRWSDGLHQAVEAKEAVQIQQESKTMATISFQNYFRLYKHLSGMTGTAATEAEEFRKIYKLDVIVIPTHQKMVRKDLSDIIYKSLDAKYNAIAAEIENLYANGQPVLVGTTSIEKNEAISTYLKKRKIPHNVLNAKNHEKEAQIISQAGKAKAVTVATNMAGRGVDIILGGSVPERPAKTTTEKFFKSKDFQAWQKEHDKVVSLGGLYVIGTERHESRRIDNQLRGRAGRQGDPGNSRFYLSLEDDLMRIFGGDQIKNIMNRLKVPEDQPIENSLISKIIEQAQVKVEGFHFDARKRVVEYDDVANQQREIIYKLRRRILESEDLHSEVNGKVKQFLESNPTLENLLEVVPFDDASIKQLKTQHTKLQDEQKRLEFVNKVIEDIYKTREKQVGGKAMREIEKFAYLGAIDHLWVDHIDHIDSLREAVGLRSIGQKDPLVEFKNEAYSLFERLIVGIDEEMARRVFRIGVGYQPEIPLDQAVTNIDTTDNIGLIEKPKAKNKKQQAVLGRNDPCWCGSGKKWKKCHYPKMGS